MSTPTAAPTIDGFADSGFRRTRAAFEQAFAGKPEMGAALAVRFAGETVVDLWGGVADARTGAPWERDTRSVVFSCTKGLMSVLIARLVERGLIEYGAPVAQYWPEFAAAGKEHITVAQALSHRAGLSAFREPVSVDELVDWNRMTARIAAAEPIREPGSGYQYHAITHGWMTGELIRRVTGNTPRAEFESVISAPLGGGIGLGTVPGDDPGVAHLVAAPSMYENTAALTAYAPPGEPDWLDLAMTLGGALPSELVSPTGGFNDPRIREAQIPGAGGIASARALATAWSATITTTDGVRLVGDDALAEATQVQSEGEPLISVPGPWPRWGMGLQLDSGARRYVTGRGFGHDGAGGQVAFADPGFGGGIGFAFVTNQLEAVDDTRATAIVDALRADLA
ncbi:serine hydrolase domain-containing protein [Homoserinibacter sp. GY 40078]|uniref:serine hydrolase domain-containing protein n=1 Tax=Homoserinibacter sp. GY 40078 TaxID=2603275 RepID=UPI0011C70ED9|nr:serine hydrolase domain-containing protein [Homoserinibacter sp. GY 40078]TXK19079.1 beta-lactamase family protein [Homoserinibacter sp. GY 40078]